jgi:hypothetical protein
MFPEDRSTRNIVITSHANFQKMDKQVNIVSQTCLPKIDKQVNIVSQPCFPKESKPQNVVSATKISLGEQEGKHSFFVRSKIQAGY